MYPVPVPQTAIISNQSYPMQQNLVPVTSNKKRSLVLICFGVAQLIVSIIFCLLCIWKMMMNNLIRDVYFALICCIFHIILSIFAIVGGRDTEKQRCIIVTCFGLAISGICFIILANLIFTWGIVFPVNIFAAFQEILDINILIVNSHFIRQNSCADTTSGSVIQPPFYQNGQTNQLAFNNPQYTLHQPYNPSLPPLNQDPATQVPQ